MATSDFAFRGQRPTPVAGCLAAALALACGTAGATSERPSWWKRPDPAEVALRWQPAPHSLPDIPAGSVVVQNCNDHGSGSLRQALANASNGATIDLTQLSCSQITLTTGSIVFTQSEITLQGPGSKYLSINGNDTCSPLRHDSFGRSYINDLTVEHGMLDAGIYTARGGCIYGNHVYINDSVVAYCTAKSEDTTGFYGANGGAVYAFSNVSLYNTSIIDSTALAPSSTAFGGGIFSVGSARIAHSFISGNYSSYSAGGMDVRDGVLVTYSTFDGNNAVIDCGAFCARGDITIVNSTVSNNQAIQAVGGIQLYAPYDNAPPTILSSTISGNTSNAFGGAIITRVNGIYGARVANSTIAFNHADGPTRYAAGLGLYGQAVNGFDLESTIIADNTYGAASSADDLGGPPGLIVTGAKNLIGSSTLPVPNDTILQQDPLLGPLAFNGGSTATHALLSGSPAIDGGNNTFNASFDQRGSGYPRVNGSAPDIGAYELEASDEIFVNGFDP